MSKSKSTYPDSGVRQSPIRVVTEIEPLYVDKRQLAQSMLVSERTVDNWRDRGVIPFIKVRGVIRFKLDEVREAIEKRFEVKVSKFR